MKHKSKKTQTSTHLDVSGAEPENFLYLIRKIHDGGSTKNHRVLERIVLYQGGGEREVPKSNAQDNDGCYPNQLHRSDKSTKPRDGSHFGRSQNSTIGSGRFKLKPQIQKPIPNRSKNRSQTDPKTDQKTIPKPIQKRNRTATIHTKKRV